MDPNGLDLLRSGLGATETVARLTADDPLVDQRQLAVVDRTGAPPTTRGRGAWTGRVIAPARTSRRKATCSTAHRSSTRWPRRTTRRRRTSGDDCCSASRPARRPVEIAAASSRRRMSIWQEGAAYGGGLDIGTDLRVDDHVAPITELGRLLDLHFLYFERPDPATLLPLEGALGGRGHRRPRGRRLSARRSRQPRPRLRRVVGGQQLRGAHAARPARPDRLGDPAEQAATAFPGHAGRGNRSSIAERLVARMANGLPRDVLDRRLRRRRRNGASPWPPRRCVSAPMCRGEQVASAPSPPRRTTICATGTRDCGAA